MQGSRKFLKAVLLAFTGLLLICASLALYIFMTYPDFDKLAQKLEAGDIIFQTSGSGQSLAISMATFSPYSHVGIVDISDNGDIKVIEAVGPVKSTRLQDWVRRGKLDRITVKRLESLSLDEKQQFVERASDYFGRPYDIYFRLGEDAIYCSELIYYAAKTSGIDLGSIQKFDDLFISNPVSKKLFEKRWKTYPDCKNKSFDECWSSILDQDLITPVSIAKDKKLRTIYSNYLIF